MLGIKTITVLLYSLYVTSDKLIKTFYLLQNLSEENLNDFPKASLALKLLPSSYFPNPIHTPLAPTTEGHRESIAQQLWNRLWSQTA